MRTSGLAATLAERAKRDKRGGTGNPLNLTMGERLDGQGLAFLPVAMEIGGAISGSGASFLKRLSELALERRGHDKIYFRKLWTTRIVMATIKRGIQGSIRNARAIIGGVAAQRVMLEEGQLSHGGAEHRLVMGYPG